MLLSGHEGEVYCCKFHPSGNTLASAGFDRLICEYWPCPGPRGAAPAHCQAAALWRGLISSTELVGTERDTPQQEGSKERLPALVASHYPAGPQWGWLHPRAALIGACLTLAAADTQFLLAEVKIIFLLNSA